MGSASLGHCILINIMTTPPEMILVLLLVPFPGLIHPFAFVKLRHNGTRH